MHTATPCDLKSPFRYARRGCPRLYFHRGASAATVFPASADIPPSLRADTPSPSESSDDGGTAVLPVTPSVWLAIDPHRTPLVPRARCWSSSQPAHREQGPDPMFSPTKLLRSLLSYSSLFVSSLQSAFTPRQSTDRWFSCLDYWSPQVRDKEERRDEQTHQLGSRLSNTPY